MGSSYVLLFCVALLSVGYCSMFADDKLNDVDEEISELLRGFSDPQQRADTEDSDEDDLDKIKEQNPELYRCIQTVFEATDETEDSGNKIPKCMTECSLAVKDNEYFNPADFPDQECLPKVTKEAAPVPQKKIWRFVRRIRRWYRRNKPRIMKGVRTATKIIGFIGKIFGKK